MLASYPHSIMIVSSLFSRSCGKQTGYQAVQTTRGSHMSCVEVFVTGIKIESSDQSPLGGRSRDQSDLWTTKNQQSRMHDYNVTIDPWKSTNQELQKGTIMWSSTLFANQKTWSWSQTLLQATCKWLPLVSLASHTLCRERKGLALVQTHTWNVLRVSRSVTCCNHWVVAKECNYCTV